jgi:hypothetical protein
MEDVKLQKLLYTEDPPEGLWERIKRKLITKTCKHCGREFTSVGYGKKYCQTKCNQAAARKRRTKHLRKYFKNYYVNNKDRYQKYRNNYLSKPEAIKKQQIRNRNRKYGMGAAQHFAIQLRKQKKKCAVCKKSLKKTSFDHNHKTNKWRGVVCPRCNTGLGFIEAPGFVKQATTYLKKWEN